MAGPGQILHRMFFWSYERMTWQYDVAVGLILVFVLLTPRSWFHDQPQLGVPANAPGEVVLVKDNGTTKTYKVDASALRPPEQTPLLENELHSALQKSLPELNNKRFTITRIDPVRNEQGTVIAYQVDVHH
jgi:phage gp29-like protein